jgi:hypothetical protein
MHVGEPQAGAQTPARQQDAKHQGEEEIPESGSNELAAELGHSILPGSSIWVTFSTVRERARKLTCAWITACFAYAAITWGSMPGCTSPASQSDHHSSHQSASHHHTSRSDQGPAPVQCFIHLCCVQLATPAGTLATSVKIALPDRADQALLHSQLVPIRPAHSLPFAHAPPTRA